MSQPDWRRESGANPEPGESDGQHASDVDLRPVSAARLIVRCEGSVVAEHVLTAGHVLSVGRSRRNDVVVPHETISRRHCEMELIHDGDTRFAVVRDFDSRNGTFLAGKRISLQRLESGEFVELGNGTYEIEFEDPDLDAAAAETVYVPRPSLAHDAARLEVLSGPGAGDTIPLDRNVVPLGPRYAPSRSAIRRVTDHYVLTRLWGVEVPRVNGRPMPERTQQLSDGDVIEFAGRTLHFSY